MSKVNKLTFLFSVSIAEFEQLNLSRGALSSINIITQSKDDQMLYLTSFKFSKYLTASLSSTYLHERGSALQSSCPN